MMAAIEFLWPPFLVAFCLVGIHAYFGIQVLTRNIVFVDLALAQIAALGATVAFMLGHPALGPTTYGYSLAFTLLAAVLLAFTRAWSARIPQEALIGVIYVVAAAAAILLIDRAPQGAEHLKQILTGNILLTGIESVMVIAPLYAAIGLLHWLLRSRLTTGSFAWEFVFYASFGVVVTSSVALAGVLLVFSFLIIPAAIGVLYADSIGRQLAIGWIAGTVSSALGLAASFLLDLPTGATMVCMFGVSLAVAGVLYPFLRGDVARASRRSVVALRWVAAALLAGSALLLMAAPRADQPLLDAAEYAMPSLRTQYFSAAEAVAYDEARRYAERYRLEAERLNEIETKSRAQGEAISDDTVAKMSSFVRSYGEMRRGEEFVMGEVRARARARLRWSLGPAMLVLGLLLAPGVPGFAWRRLRSRRAALSP
jgi:zinc/manganese transport system permease protein